MCVWKSILIRAEIWRFNLIKKSLNDGESFLNHFQISCYSGWWMVLFRVVFQTEGEGGIVSSPLRGGGIWWGYEIFFYFYGERLLVEEQVSVSNVSVLQCPCNFFLFKIRKIPFQNGKRVLFYVRTAFILLRLLPLVLQQ